MKNTVAINYTLRTPGGILVTGTTTIHCYRGIFTVIEGNRREIVSDEFMIMIYRLRAAEAKALKAHV